MNLLNFILSTIIRINSRMGKVSRRNYRSISFSCVICINSRMGKVSLLVEEILQFTTECINSRMGKVRTVFCDSIEIIRFILYIVNIITKNHSIFPVIHKSYKV